MARAAACPIARRSSPAIRDNPDRATRRDIAKAFGVKASERSQLTALIKSLAEDGATAKTRRNFRVSGGLPPVAVLDVFGRDSDGGLIARPSEWNEAEGEAPVVHVKLPRFQKGPVPGVGSRVLAKIFRNAEDEGPLYTARVLKLFDRKSERRALGILRQTANGEWRAEPVERRQPEFLLDAGALGTAKIGDLVEVEPVGRPGYGPPRGRVVMVVGPAVTEKAVSMIAIHAHGIPHEFPPAALDEAAAAKPARLSGREDWRALPFVTIDPADAKDHDDAVHAETDPETPGGFVVRVAIADVAAYVTGGGALDREALKRGNSVYFPDRVVPMLPERISNDLCSLKENVDRPALAFVMKFAADGRKTGHTLHRVMIRSVAKLAYPQAQAAIDGAPDDKTGPLVGTVLKPLYAAYAALERGRRERGPLELDLPERKILLKPDGTVDRVVIPERLAAHRLIEEFMIQANVAAAETLETARQALIYRIHDAPSLAKQEALRGFLKTLSMSLARGAQLRPAQFNSILAEVEGSDLETLVNEVVLRSQSQAEYSKANIGHFGLNLRRYAHFTSPIRRYADLIVHRALISAGKLGDDGLTRAEESRLEEISALISASERRAMAAERETVDRLVAAHLADRVGETFPARVSGVARAGVFVQLTAFGADGFVPVSTLGDDYYIHDEALHAVVGSRTGKGYRLGDSVEVSLTDVQPMAGAMQMKMESEPRPIAGATISFHKSRGPRRRAMSAAMRGRRRK
ncbi:MAG: ribonuclease R [Phyllobacteriaceae bacterium]|nr:ribonuclease R [Phyllobacteriaceae bacterium]